MNRREMASGLVSDLRGIGSSASGAAAAAELPSTDFARHEDYRPVKLQLAALDQLGLSHPFFRLNESGATLHPVIEGRSAVSFASYNYLGLNGHPDVVKAANDAANDWGISASASRLVGGERPLHRRLEAALARLHGTEAALTFVSGHATNATAIAALIGPEDLIVHDALAHNSVTVGARLSGARRLILPHNDIDWLDRRLAACRGEHRYVLIAVEGLYSMDGDTPDLRGLAQVKQRHAAWLMVDEAHSVGVLGQTGRGLCEHSGVAPSAVDIWMGTLSKTLASCGGYICGSEDLIALLKARASGFVYSVAMAPPLAAAAEASIQVMLKEPERAARLRRNSTRFFARAQASGLDLGLAEGHAVIPVMVGDSLRALRASAELFDRGVFALPIVPPAVPERTARLRFFLTSEHSADDIDRAVDETVGILTQLAP